ncbi:uncharacterized protein LOC114295956 [Camellia sinensis]|uniref:uncharacterized protein LOC114295956 n=1 Tax=Camellia sinensis TaxID=4442 RepID=UPI0010366762|nr:uncharacterized protein LOC114295956 [Camellia sinensis]
MYKDLKRNFWWNNMKREIAQYVAQCLVCQQVKVEYQRPAGKLQHLPIPEWKWEHITMDFVTGLPRTQGGNNAIWVIVDRLTKSTHFLAFKVGFSLEKFAKLYIKEIVKLHGIPVTIVFDRDNRFVSMFWRSLHTTLGTSLNFSTAFHPQTDGQTERTIQTLEDMLRAYVIDLEDNRRRDLVFGVGDHVFLKVSPMKGVMRFGVRGKLSPRFIGPFEVLDRIGEVAYRLALPPSLVGVHNVFHVSMLRKYIPNPSHVIDHAPLQFKGDLTFEEHPIQIVNRKEQAAEKRTAKAKKKLAQTLATKAKEIRETDAKAYKEGKVVIKEGYKKQVDIGYNRGYDLGWTTTLIALFIPKDSPHQDLSKLSLSFPHSPTKEPQSEKKVGYKEGDEEEEVAGTKSPC